MSTSKVRKSIVRSLDSDSATRPYVGQIRPHKLVPIPFTPEHGAVVEDDGVPLTKAGRTFREVVATAQDIDVTAVDLGIVRLFEALNANTDLNLAGLSRPMTRRTEFGTLTTVQVVVNTPLLLPWLINGRALRRLAAKLRGETTVLTAAHDHDQLALPVMDIAEVDQVMSLVSAQRELLGFDAYKTGTPPGRLMESLAVNGVLDPPDVVFAQLTTPDGSCWTAQTIEGTQRLFGSQHLLELLSGRDVTGLLTRRWLESGNRLRDLTGADLADLPEQLTFPDSEAAAQYFPGRDVTTWLDTVATDRVEAIAWQLLRTMTINLVIAVEPSERTRDQYDQPIAATIQEFIRAYHVHGKAKTEWSGDDVDGLAAISVIDRFTDQERIEPWRRRAWLGQDKLTWDGPVGGSGADANRLLETVRLIAGLTVQGACPSPGGEPSLAAVDAVLRENSVRVHAHERARVATAQAIMVLDYYATGSENQVKAALQATFRDPLFWNTEKHKAGNWTDMLGVPIAELTDKAVAELAGLPQDFDVVTDCGPAQRALAALGATALIVNPVLLKADQALTRTGRGGGGKATNVSAADPSSLIKKMIVDRRGLQQLHNAVISLVAGRTPSAPADPLEEFELTDFALREMWLGSGRRGPDETEQSATATFQRLLRDMLEIQQAQVAAAEELRTKTRYELQHGEEPGETDDVADEDADVLYEVVGIAADVADQARAALRLLDEFFLMGKAYGETANRYGNR